MMIVQLLIPSHVLAALSVQQSLSPWIRVTVRGATCSRVPAAPMMPFHASTLNRATSARETPSLVGFSLFCDLLTLQPRHYFSGYICPATHPYTCGGGLRCSKAAWKPIIMDNTSNSYVSDCDGGLLVDKESICCPLEGVVRCNDKDGFKCRSNPSLQGNIVTTALVRSDMTKMLL